VPGTFKLASGHQDCCEQWCLGVSIALPVPGTLNFGRPVLKTYRNLYPQVYAWENLELAYKYAAMACRPCSRSLLAPVPGASHAVDSCLFGGLL